MITKQEADEIMKIPGNTKGSEHLTIFRYIKNKYGDDGVKKLEQKVTELGYPLSFGEINLGSWYPEAHFALTLLVAKDLFGWRDFREFGRASVLFSFGLKVFIKFVSTKTMFDLSPKYWNKFMDFGSLEAVEFNEKEKYLIVRLRDYKIHPLMCGYYAELLVGLIQLSRSKREKAVAEETKCMWRGDQYDEFKISWK